MHRIFRFAVAASLALPLTAPHLVSGETSTIQQEEIPGKALIGRWDITVDRNGKPAPSWLEVKLSGYRTLVGSFVSTEGSARPVSEIKYENGKFSFSIPKQWEQGDNDLVVSGQLAGSTIEGTVTTPSGETYRWKGVKAPYMKRSAEPTWGKPVELFNGKDLKGWKVPAENQWQVKDGILINPRAGVNLISEQKFEDFKLHIEFRYPEGSNSGVYLRGRHEVQIMDTPQDEHPSSVLYGGVYGFLTPSEIAAKAPGEWQEFDITLVGRMVTIVANGKTVICNQEIPGITGGALDSNEGEPGPVYIQGDHGPVEFRKITITPAR
jgi:Splicing factor